MVLKVEVLLALCALAAASPIGLKMRNDGYASKFGHHVDELTRLPSDGLLNGVLDVC